MNNPLNNLPPFYIGQKVICKKSATGHLKKGSIYTITGLVSCSCGISLVSWGQSAPAEINRMDCDCYKNLPFPNNQEYYVNSSYFAPIQEFPFPSLTYSEVVEKESELISLN